MSWMLKKKEGEMILPEKGNFDQLFFFVSALQMKRLCTTGS